MSASENTDTEDFFARMVQEHLASLRIFMRVLGVRAACVEDMVQDTFVVAYKRFGTFDVDRDFGKWLRGIARNVVMNELRKQARHARIMDENVTRMLLDQEEDVRESTVSDEVLRALTDCLSQLPPERQELLRNKYAQGRNSSDLAASLGQSPVSVRLLLMRLRIAVQRCMELKLGSEWA